MKRTRETINYTHPHERWDLSGATQFDGEDIGFEERTKKNQALQKEWLLQQMEDKKRQQALAKE